MIALIAGLLSRTGASRVILVLGELGLLRLVLSEAAVGEVRRNLASKLPEAAPLFEEFLGAVPVQIYQPTPHDRERARELADAKDVTILAAAIGARARMVVTHDIRHFRSSEEYRSCAPGHSSRKAAHGWDPSDGELIEAATLNRGLVRCRGKLCRPDFEHAQELVDSNLI